jgi:hypothetical protein
MSAPAQHTPGAWTVTDNSWEISTVYGPAGQVIAECPIDSTVLEETQDEFEAVKEANARLIAAAPELLKACSDWIDWLKPDAPFREDAADYEAQMLDAMRAAIAKARGQ